MLKVNERLGDFQIIRLLGKGGMGEVYEARQSNPDRKVALKVLAPWLADDEDSLKRFFREAEVPANLDHPGIVRIIVTGKSPEGTAYFAMHLVRGMSLAEMIRRATSSPTSEVPTQTVESAKTPSMAGPESGEPGPVSPVPMQDSIPPLYQEYRHDRWLAVAHIGAQAARALAYAHDQGHIHRDIKPSNLMVDIHNQVYLVDFGLTRGLQPGAEGTQPGTLIGTYWYMSPEQAEGSRDLDARSDIYSLGVTLYELATQGIGPWTANRDDKKSILTQVRTGQALPLRTEALGIPHKLEQIITKAMQLKPHKRYETAAEMAADLEAFAGIESKHSPRPRQLLQAAPKRRWWTWAAGVAIASSLVFGMVIAVAVAMRDRTPVDHLTEPVDDYKFNGSKAQPTVLGDKANIGVKVELLDDSGIPRWMEHLYGDGKPSPSRDHFFSLSADTILAVADPDSRNFEFNIEPNGVTPNADYGVFFGWRRRSKYSTAPHRIFLVQCKSHADAEGQITLGTAGIIQGNEKINPGVQGWLNQISGGKYRQTVPPRNSPGGRSFLRILVQGDNVEISVPFRAPIVFSLADLKRDNPAQFRDMSTAGAVGVWCKTGAAIFQGASITRLKE